MKRVLMIALVCAFTLPAFAQQTQQDTTKKANKMMKKGHRKGQADSSKTDTTKQDTTKKKW